MTVTLYTNPDAGDASTRYTATVGGVAADVRMTSETTEYDLPGFWGYLVEKECSYLFFDSDVAAEVAISPVDSNVMPLATAFVVPSTIPWTLSGGVLTLTLSPGQCVRVETDNERGDPIYVFCRDLVTTPTGGTVDTYDGSQTEATTGRTLVFPAGVHDIFADTGDASFPIEDDATVFIHGGAKVVGRFDCRGTTGHTITGRGVLSGEYTDNATVGALPSFDDKYEFTAILGDQPLDATISGITIVASPFYSISSAANFHSQIMVLVPYVNNSDGIKPLAEIGGDGRPFTIDRCALWVGDDAIDMHYWRRSGSVTDCLVSTSGSACFLHGYLTESYAEPSYGFAITVSGCVVRPVCDYYIEEDDDEGGAVIQVWTDGERNPATIGNFNVTYRDLRVESDSNGINCVLLSMGNTPYPWGESSTDASRDNNGSVSNWLLEDVWLSHVPAEISKIRSLNSVDTPSGVAFKRLSMGGLAVGVRNHADFFDINEVAFNITFDGASV